MCAHPLGLEKAKSLLVVKDDKTFIDLIAEQVGGCRSVCELLGQAGPAQQGRGAGVVKDDKTFIDLIAEQVRTCVAVGFRLWGEGAGRARQCCKGRQDLH